MINKVSGETWKPLQFKGYKALRNKYALSSMGRAASYREDIYDDGKILQGSLTSGYRTLNLHIGDINGTLYFHREIARLFKPKQSPREKFVIHLNHDKTDNRVKNLKWATQQEVIDHQQKSPDKLAYKEVQRSRTRGQKLTAAKVNAIRKILDNENRRLTHKQIAEKYPPASSTK